MATSWRTMATTGSTTASSSIIGSVRAASIANCRPRSRSLSDAEPGPWRMMGAGQAVSAVVRVRPAPGPGETPLDLDKSKLSLAMVKDNDPETPVTATVRMRDGAVSMGAGTARLTLDLDSFESNIHVRNERVRGIFFESATSGWDTAELSIARLPDDVLSAIRDKRRVSHAKMDGSVKLHGATIKLPLVIDAGLLETGALWVKSSQPVAVKVSDFGLSENLKKLATTCKHDSIDDVVKVDVSLEFMPP